MLVFKAVKSVFAVFLWKMKYGSGVKAGFPQAMEKVTLEKDREGFRSEHIAFLIPILPLLV